MIDTSIYSYIFFITHLSLSFPSTLVVIEGNTPPPSPHPRVLTIRFKEKNQDMYCEVLLDLTQTFAIFA